MTDSCIGQLMDRIKTATPESQIAVFSVDDHEFPERLNAVFASTVITQKMIKNNDSRFIGVYDGTHDLLKVKKNLSKIITEQQTVLERYNKLEAAS